jgi:hypothetical protein
MGNTSGMELYKDKTKPEYYLSRGLQNLGIDIAYEYMGKIVEYKPQYIASVGSGSGTFEKLLCEKLQIEIICVDPNGTYGNAPSEYIMKSQFPDVKNLIKYDPSVVGNCAIILNWAYPNDSTYDYDAVQDLKPKWILWIGDPTGIAGGEKFIGFYEETKEGKGDYKIVQEHVKEIREEFAGTILYTIAILERI